MARDIKRDIGEDVYIGQIDEIVHGFMHLWTRFGAILPHELAKIRQNLEGVSPTSEIYPDTDYELFFRVSSVLSRGNSLTMGELSNALAVPLSTATRIIDLLVDRGYVHRLPDPDDRRVVRIALTEEGNELHGIISTYIRQRIEHIMTGLTDVERTTLFALIFKIASILRINGEE